MTRTLVLALVLVAVARPALACRRDEISLAQAFTLADAVFVGRVVAVRKTPVDAARCAKHPAWCVYEYTAEVAVEGVWKGTPPARVDVFAGSGRGDCSFGRLDADRRYLFMASAPKPGTLVLEIGRGTARATPAQLARVSTRFGAPTPPR